MATAVRDIIVPERTITEERTITFPLDAVTRALRYCFSRPEFSAPPGQMLNIELTPAAGCTVTWEHLGGRYSKIALSNAQTAAMLLVFLKHLHVPIPRAATKALSATDGQTLALHLRSFTPV